ncbi:hypothetical protein TVAG_200250 [Trichomonas vaginalis G3]|uniref:ATPase domain-containing protein n=1 Tax=Trichomonas vaginalis (strain ATCC PRA-98 / G3) TaxID=412133 RepID=A2G234_TRIV3|nr:hypothetical protein TVAGG3_0080820 [Trichomonas vaginalis G3]EAX88792.1 hypothetical protein TVAG_200250 [Trichomonas vaginalis G3]KAI5543232.1 hypothetical protein TVAGG3_0080820 [Trichomonas vaginalis G3]|eukprot:XP_001301722.1 hypothetical protein [Trichomonas vaginalis G3]
MARNSSNSRLRKIVGWSILILFISIIIFILTLRKPFVRHTGRIPYGWDSKLNKTLHQYISTVPTRHVVILTGGYQSGKTRALEEVQYELLRGDSFVINVDFSTARNTNDIIGLVKTAVFSGLAMLKQPTGAQRRFLVKYLPPQSSEVIYGIHSVYSQLYFVLSSKIDLLHNGTIGWSEFFNSLEEVNQYIPVACLFNSIDNIIVHCPELFNALLNRFALRKDYVDYVPIICELRDTSLRTKFSLFDSSIKIYELDEVFQPEKVFVKSNKIFTVNELKAITSRFGYHGGIFERVFEDLKHGRKLADALDSVSEFVSKDLSKLNISKELALKVCGNQTVIAPSEINEFHPLLVKGYIWMSEDYRFKFAHVGIKDYICNH